MPKHFLLGTEIRVVEAGTIIEDPNGIEPPVTVDDRTSAALTMGIGGTVYCTQKVYDKIKSRVGGHA
jgi:hypothetical protein